MERRFRPVVLTGGRSAAAPDRRRLTRSALRVLRGGPSPEVEQALAEAVLAARQMREDIERRIASALEAPRPEGARSPADPAPPR